MAYKYLKDEQHYYDLYDRFTVEGCLRTEKIGLSPATTEKHKLQKEWAKTAVEVMLYFEKGERYANRMQTVREWIEKDRKRDEHFGNSIDPKNVSCKFCEKEMELAHKSLETYPEPDRMSYVYVCKGCQVLKYIWENGKVEDVIPWKCPNCDRKLKITDKREGSKLSTTKLCSVCGYKDDYVLDLSHEKEPDLDPNEIKEFRINKDRFCLSDKEGMEYVQFTNNFKRLQEMLKKTEKPEAKKKIKVLTLPQLEKKLERVFGEEKYTKFAFGEPNTIGYLTVYFSVQDPTQRDEYASKKLLRDLLKKTLNGTNWELMTAGIDYKLGVLTGRLKGKEESDVETCDFIY